MSALRRFFPSSLAVCTADRHGDVFTGYIPEPPPPPPPVQPEKCVCVCVLEGLHPFTLPFLTALRRRRHSTAKQALWPARQLKCTMRQIVEFCCSYSQTTGCLSRYTLPPPSGRCGGSNAGPIIASLIAPRVLRAHLNVILLTSRGRVKKGLSRCQPTPPLRSCVFFCWSLTFHCRRGNGNFLSLSLLPARPTSALLVIRLRSPLHWRRSNAGIAAAAARDSTVTSSPHNARSKTSSRQQQRWPPTRMTRN